MERKAKIEKKTKKVPYKWLLLLFSEKVITKFDNVTDKLFSEENDI